METTEPITLQTERFLRKIVEKFPACEEPTVMTDIHVRISPDSGEMKAYDDDDKEITRCVVEQWIDCPNDDFYDVATALLRRVWKSHHEAIDSMGVLKPFSFVLEDEDNTFVAELYMADDDTIILGGDLMEGLNQDLDHFWNGLIKD